MYNIFSFFTRETLEDAVTWDYSDNPDYKNPVEACVYVQFAQIFNSGKDHRDISKLSKFLVHGSMDFRKSEDYARTYNDYQNFLAYWNDVVSNFDYDLNERLLREAMGLNETPVIPVAPVTSLEESLAECLMILQDLHDAVYVSKALNPVTGLKLMARVSRDYLTLIETSGII